MRKVLPAGGLYAITLDLQQTLEELVTQVDAALRGGAVMVQYRRKTQSPATQRREAAALLAVCERHGGIFIINDDIDLALAIGAHGVHLGREDESYHALASDPARALLLGVSCYDSLTLARRAYAAGVDYLAFGSLFPSLTKPQAIPCTLAVIAQARREFTVPIVAIGGITPENGGPVVAAGAHFIAAIGGVFSQTSVTASAARYARLFPY